MRLTRSAAFFVLLALLLAIGVLAILDAARRHAGAEARVTANRALASWFGVTDLCLFTEARYTRHPSLADRHSPFQDYPLAMEHFPSGSLVLPPSHLSSADGIAAAPHAGSEKR
jgi:hypothetical protein